MDEAKTEENKGPDHRRLGYDLDLFTFSDLVGPGLPLFTPRGTILRDELLGFSEELQRKNGFQKVAIPHITKEDLYKTSGHWDKFGHELFLVKSQETKDQMVLKPMNCPHHIEIYASRPRSYRELPIRYMENTIQYRDEKKGELNGLMRVRSISIDDGHIFCRKEDIEHEFTVIMEMIKEMYSVFGMEFRARLSFRDDSDEYLGDKEDWDEAQRIIEEVAKKLELKYEVAEGDAAFYGPKIDIMVTDSLGREWQCATQQLDFVMPKRFNLTYTNTHGKEQSLVMIHKALLGSFERFLAVYLEHTNGHLPVWLAPEQLRFITVNDSPEVIALTREFQKFTDAAGIRSTIDDSKETIGKKIYNADILKVPHKFVVGPQEVESFKDVDTSEWDKSTPGEFFHKIAQEINERKDRPELYKN
jgi:threonyl-tRNA synthetase